MADTWQIRPQTPADEPEWLRMRQALWPDFKLAQMQKEMAEILADPKVTVFLLARPDGSLGGFIEVSLRPWADGCESSPVGYIEAWYVDPDLRRQRAGAALVETAEAWARAQGCSEMASDCELWNEVSYLAHRALGYEETLRIIEFRKSLAP
jgi:aminoglycoside 6'-N-acetyltransferase I